MPGLPDLILKAPVFARLEALSRNQAFWQTQAAQDLLNALIADLDNPAKKIIDIVKAAGLYNTNSTNHFEVHWLNSTGQGYWFKMQTQVEAVLRAGMKRACEIFVANNYAKPFEYFWVISGDQNSSRWEMSISEGANQVTVIFHTPQTPPVYPNTIANPKMTIARYDTGTGKAKLEPVQVPVP